MLYFSIDMVAVHIEKYEDSTTKKEAMGKGLFAKFQINIYFGKGVIGPVRLA